MTVNVCPAAAVAAPMEVVWGMLMRPETYDQWWDAHTRRIEPPGPATPGQVIYAWSKGLGRRWEVRLTIKQVDANQHQIVFDTVFPLGIRGHNQIRCMPIDERSCWVQFG